METDTVARMKMCRRVLKLLRNDTEIENPYQYSLYMNYKAFTDPLNPVCEKKKIRVSENTVGEHMGLTCYGRPTISSNTIVYLREISIFYGPEDSMIVLKCVGYSYCDLLEWFDKNDGSSFSELPAPIESIVAKKVPITADIKDLDYIFKNSKNKIYSMRYVCSFFLHFCFGNLTHLCLGFP